MYAIAHIAIHDALNAIDRRFAAVRLRRAQRRPAPRLRPQSPPPPDDALVAVLARPAVRAVPAGVRRRWHRRRRRRLHRSAGGDPRRRGQDATASPSARRRQRRSSRCAPATTPTTRRSSTPTTRRETQPGEYEFTPGTPFAFAPKWGSVTPFALADSTQFASGPPYPLTSKRYADDYNEVKRLGGVRQRAHRRPDRDRHVLGRELAAGLEPHGARHRRRPRARPVGQRPACSDC